MEQHFKDLEKTFDTLRRHRMMLNPSKCTFDVEAGKFLRFMISQREIKANPEKIKAILDMASPKTVKEI